MKINKDTQKAIFLEEFSWVDFKNKNEIHGRKIICIFCDSYEKVEVKVKKGIDLPLMSKFKPGDFIMFKDLEINIWEFKDKHGVSFMAESVVKNVD